MSKPWRGEPPTTCRIRTVVTGNATPTTPAVTLNYPDWFVDVLAGRAPHVDGVTPIVGGGAGAYVAGPQALGISSVQVAVRRMDGGNIASGTNIAVHVTLVLP